MSNHISSVINNQKKPIGNRIKSGEVNPIELLDSRVVDLLLQDYSDLIDVSYTAWFAKRFYTLPFDLIHNLASQARQDGKDPKRLFIHLIKKSYGL